MIKFNNLKEELEFIEDLKSSPEMQQKIRSLIIEFTQKEEVKDYVCEYIHRFNKGKSCCFLL